MDNINTTEERVETDSTHLPKRRKITHDDSLLTLQHDEYTIAWICALHIEMAAARAVLDEIHECLPVPRNDSNTYILGRIKRHNIVIACLPIDRYGIVNAANVVTNMKQTFPAIRVGLMVGIGGGVPSETDIRLGDIVVGTRVMQADLGKMTGDGQLEQTGVARFPDQILATAVSSLRAKHELEPSRVPSILQQKLDGSGYGRPSSPDRLFHATYKHENPQNSCDKCDISKIVPRSIRPFDVPVIHYGAIASGSQVVKSSAFRDKVARELKILCFEMEAAGLMDILPCIPIRGICDYSDSHKSKDWQKYAAATAAAYATELLQELPVTEVHTRVSCRSVPQQVPSQEQRQRMLDSLRFEQIDARRTNIKKAHAKTCRWFLSHQDYKAWLDQRQLTQHHGFMWVGGKPGAGKSTIMKFAYLNMKNKARNKDEVTASFFFNARGEYLEKSIPGMYRSLLLQILEGYPDLQRVLDDFDLAPSPTEDTSLSLNTLKDLLCTAILALGQRPFTCFVDALDECDEQQIIDMIQYFEDLAEQSTARGVQFRICFSSRHYPYLSTRWGLRFTLEHQAGHTEDLETYVESRLQIRDPRLIEKLRPEILRKAAGVFMWVVLVVDILNKEYRRGAMFMEKKLESLPSGLSDLFKDILQRDKENMAELKLCIIWILCAKRPLQPREFYHALWSGLSFEDPDESEMPDASGREIGEDDLPRFYRYVISSSKGLAEVTNSTNQSVQFIHESVRDFLIKDKGLYELWPELGADWKSPSHELLKQCCSFYMTHRAVHDSISILSEENKSEHQAIDLDKYPFLGYAKEFVFYHANAAAKVVPQDEFLSSFQIVNWIKINNLLSKYRSREYSPDASLYYILAERTSPELIRTRFKKDPNVHVAGERYRYPLFAALAKGEKSNVAALLNSPLSIQDGVDLTDGLKLTRDLQGYKGRTPLTWAAENGRLEIIKLLLQTGIDVNDLDTSGQTPLSRASSNGQEMIMRFLLDHNAEVNTCNHIKETPLSQASENGHEIIIRILLDQGAEVNTCDYLKITPLFKASCNGYELVTRILLDHKAEVNTYDDLGRTPLFEASRQGYELVTRILLDHKAEVNTYDDLGRTPLSGASLNGHETVTRILLDHGAEVNTCEQDGQTPLSIASLNGHETVVRILLDHGAEVNTCDKDGRTPLSGALLHGHETVARILLDYGAEVNTCEQDGQTPLLITSLNGHETVVRILLDHGAEVNTCDKDGQTPLSGALLHGHETVARILLDHGAEVNTCEKDGRTPLLEALSGGHEAVARILLNRGAKLSTGTASPTELELALREGCHEVAIILIRRGAMVGPGIETIYQGKIARNFVAVARQLRESGFDLIVTGHEVYMNAVHTALLVGCLGIAKWLLQREPSFTPDDFIINADLPPSNICLAGFVQSRSLLDVEFAIQCGVDLNRGDKYFNRTALHWAAVTDDRCVVNMLLETDVNPNLIDFSGQTPLHHAAKNGHEEVARRLLEVTDASIIDSKGRTALKCARDNDHVSTARLLLSSWSGSDVCTDSQGKTLEDWMNLVGQLNGTDRLWGRSSSEPARLERISDLE